MAHPVGGSSGSQQIRRRSWDKPICRGEKPSVRSGHIAVLDESGTNMYVFGGYHDHACFSDLFCLHLPSHTWARIVTTGDAPSMTASHSGVLVGETLVTFGGSGVPFGHANSNTMHMLNLRTNVWEAVPARGRHPYDVPSPRYGQSLVRGPDNASLYLFGGTSGHVFSADLFRFDLARRTWEQVLAANPDNGPPPCYRHECVVYDNKMFVLGGGAPNPTEGDVITVYSYDFATREWANLTDSMEVAGKGDRPAPRRSHTCVLYRDTVFMCGGTDGEVMMDDLWALHLPTLTWTRLPADGFVPNYFHTAVVTPSGRMHVFGGCLDRYGVTRSNDVVSVWLGRCPTLVELCTDAIAALEGLRSSDLHEYGVPETLIGLVSNKLSDDDEEDGDGKLPSKRSAHSLRSWLAVPAANAAVQLCKKVFVGTR